MEGEKVIYLARRDEQDTYTPEKPDYHSLSYWPAMFIKRTISRSTGRITFIALVFGSRLIAAIALGVRSPELNPGDIDTVSAFLLSVYLPLIAIMAGFYFSEKRTSATGGKTASETFFFAALVTGVWVGAPPLFIIFASQTAQAIELLTQWRTWGESVAALAVSFYFVKPGEES
jgi:hypothetical protein